MPKPKKIRIRIQIICDIEDSSIKYSTAEDEHAKHLRIKLIAIKYFFRLIYKF